MKTIKKLLKQSDKLAGKTTVTLQLDIPLKKLRANAKLISSLGASKINIELGSKPAVIKAKPAASAKKTVKKTVAKKKPAVISKPQAAAKKAPVKAKAAAKKAPVKATVARKKAPPKTGRTTAVTQAAVLAAIGANNNTPQTISNAMQANPVQVSKALSRYTQQGLIVRTQPGHYALKS